MGWSRTGQIGLMNFDEIITIGQLFHCKWHPPLCEGIQYIYPFIQSDQGSRI